MTPTVHCFHQIRRGIQSVRDVKSESQRKGRAMRKERLESESERETVFRFFARPFQNAKSILSCGWKFP